MEKSVVAAEHVTCGFAQFGLGLTKLADTVPDRTIIKVSISVVPTNPIPMPERHGNLSKWFL